MIQYYTDRYIMDLLVKKVTKSEGSEVNTKKSLDFKSKKASFKALVNVARLTANPGWLLPFLSHYTSVFT